MHNVIKSLLFIVPLLCSCGKKVEDNSDVNSRRVLSRNPSRTIMTPFIQRQTVECEDELSCPESVAKIVVIDREKIRYCTGTLISSDVMLTSATCLTASLRTPKLDCSQNIFVVFPQIGIRPLFRAGCKQILSAYGNQSSEASLWRGDFAFLKLDREIPRTASQIKRSGLEEFNTYTTWKVDYVNDTNGHLKKATCYPIFNSYANPFANNSRAPMIPVSDCELVEGNAGAPIMANNGDLVGISSTGLDETITQFILNSDLLDEPMAHIHHMANLACVKTPIDKISKIEDKFCNRPISISLLDQLRSNMIFSTKIHQEEFRKIQEELEIPVKYFKWNVGFDTGPRGRVHEVSIKKPECFFDIQNWIGEFTRFGGRIRTFAVLNIEIPRYRVQTKLTRLLRPVSVVSSSEVKSYRVEFNPKNAFKYNNTFVNLKGQTFGQDGTDTFEAIPNCMFD